jgi:hypothetical protein
VDLLNELIVESVAVRGIRNDGQIVTVQVAGGVPGKAVDLALFPDRRDSFGRSSR